MATVSQMEGGWFPTCGSRLRAAHICFKHLQELHGLRVGAKDPTIRSWEYRDVDYLLQWRPLWGHEPCEECADMCGGVHNTNGNDRPDHGGLSAGETERERV
eukprot:5416799-Pyramimonas_sp.AAC.1